MGDIMEVTIDGVEYVKKSVDTVKPVNDIGATHWAVCPEGSIIFYKITHKAELWLPMSKVWNYVTIAPYTMFCFDDE